jgi:hypothetical protein
LIDLRITPPEFFFDRRDFLKALGGALALGSSSCQVTRLAPDQALIPPFERPDVFPVKRAEPVELPLAFDAKV